MIDFDLIDMLSDYAARGGSVSRIASGKRAHSRAYMRDVIDSDDKRMAALAREDYRKARKVERRAMRRARRAEREALA